MNIQTIPSLPACVILLALLGGVGPAAAEPTTSTGRMSVAQVMEMLDKAPANPMAAQVLTSYLLGVGETAGVLLDAAKARRNGPAASCRSAMTLETGALSAALLRAAPDRGRWPETPATPIVVNDMMNRAGCRLIP